MGRAARHLNGRAILYADVMTASMRRAIDETTRPANHPEVVQRDSRNCATIHHQAHRYEPGGGGEGDYVTVPLEPEEDGPSSAEPLESSSRRWRSACASRT